MSPIDKFRCEILEQVSNVNSLKNSWPSFQSELDKLIGQNPNSSQIFTIGENLSQIFRSNSGGGRSQSVVAAGGAAWECLVTWYLNLVFWGTNVLVTRQNRKFIPSVIYDAFSVTIANHKTNTESDIVVYSVPDIGNLKELSIDDIDELIRANMTGVDTGVVQCKTNWNDNAQIPMLWDLIYNSTSFRIPNVYVGTNGVNPSSFRSFGYSFVTVPSGNDVYNTNSVAVLRVKNLTGGNYWGKSTQQGVCNSLSNYFGRNFVQHFNGGVQTHINNQLSSDPDYYPRFRNLSF